MKTVLVFSVIILCAVSGCSARDYHLYMATESFGAEQSDHLNAMQKAGAFDAGRQARRRVCPYFPAGLGGYSESCSWEAIPPG